LASAKIDVAAAKGARMPRQALQAAMSAFSVRQKGAKDEIAMNDGGFG
jgi:hypothetical protein